MSQSLTATRQYDTYGALLSQTGPWKGPLGYSGSAGYQEDETGLQLLGHRYYDPSTGRFLTRDPIKDGRNWYAYCDNNPISRVDADGLKSATAAALGHGILLRIMQLPPWIRDRLLALLGMTTAQANQMLQRGQNATPHLLYRYASPAEQAATMANRGRPVPSPHYEEFKLFHTTLQESLKYKQMADRNLPEPGSKIIQFENPFGLGTQLGAGGKMDGLHVWGIKIEDLPRIGGGEILKRLNDRTLKNGIFH